MARVAYIKFRSGTAAQWTSANPVLGAGEPGFEANTGLFKLGDGVAEWTALSYAAITTAAGDTRYALATAVGAVSGIATLDGSGKLPASQLPALRIVSISTVADEAARLALSVTDDARFVVQTDTASTWVLAGGADPSVAGNWTVLPSAGAAGLEQVVNKGAASGYCPLDASSLVPVAYLPTIDGGTP